MRLIDADNVIFELNRMLNIVDERNARPDQKEEFKTIRTYVEWTKEVIHDTPTIDAKTVWIPCSERLPSAEDCPMDCMVTRRSKYVGNYTDMAVAEADGTWTHEDWKAITIDGNATCISTRDADIIAWMPLPEPYTVDTPQTKREGE